MLGLEVSDELRGRTFAFIQALVRISLVAVLAISPLVAAAIGEHTFSFGEAVLTYNGAAFTMLGGGCDRGTCWDSLLSPNERSSWSLILV